MPKIPIVKSEDFYKYLLKYGCTSVGVRGSHHKICNPKTNKVSIVAVHIGKDFDRGSFLGVLNQLGIDVDDFAAFIQ